MATADSVISETSATALPGLARALISAGKLGQKSAEEISRKAHGNRTSFLAELTGMGAVSAADLAHTVSTAFGAPLVDLDAVDATRLPKLLDPKMCQAFRVVVLSKRNNRLIVATADPSDQQAAEKIKFATQMGVDWIVAEYDKLTRLVEASSASANETVESIVAEDFEFSDLNVEEVSETADDDAASEVEDAPVVKFLQKMLLDAYNMRASDLHFEPYEHTYRVDRKSVV